MPIQLMARGTSWLIRCPLKLLDLEGLTQGSQHLSTWGNYVASRASQFPGWPVSSASEGGILQDPGLDLAVDITCPLQLVGQAPSSQRFDCLAGFAGASVWSVWTCSWAQVLPKQPSRRIPGTATCVATRASMACSGGGMTGPHASRCFSPTTMTKSL